MSQVLTHLDCFSCPLLVSSGKRNHGSLRIRFPSKGDSSYNDAAKETGVSTNTLYKIIKAQTSNPTPDILSKLATAYGATKQRQRQIYADLMRLAGYMDMMPRRVWQVLREEGKKEEEDRNGDSRAMSSAGVINVIPEAQDTLKEMSGLSEGEQRALLFLF